MPAGNSIFTGAPLLSPGLPILLVQITLILVVTRAVGGLIKRVFKQPSVVSEILAGILLGKSLLGRIPGYTDALFPKSSMEGFSLIAEFGLVLYMFLVGLEMDVAQLVRTGRSAMAIAAAGIAVPFALGIGVAAAFQHFILSHDPATNPSFFQLCVFTGVGMSLTAFPVLARLLHESKLIATPVGRLTLAAAAFNDAVAWVLLAVALALVQAGGSPVTPLYTLLGLVVWAAVLVLGVRPLLQLVVAMVNSRRSRSWRNALLALVFVAIFVSSWATAVLGLDAIFGAFLMGLILPRDEALVHIVEKIEGLVVVVFLPLYFTLSGLRTNVASLDSWRSLGILVLVLVAAVVGKVAGCYGAARWVGIGERESLAIGVLMNTRGLIELIVLNLGLQAHIYNEEVFSCMCLMAVITTMMSTPSIRHVYPKALWEAPAAASTATAPRWASRLRTLSSTEVGSSDSEGGVSLVNILVPSHEANSTIAGLHLLLPGSTTRTVVTIVSFSDSTSTATVIRERVGLIKDPDARLIGLAARLLGAEVDAKQVVAASSDLSGALVQLLAPARGASSLDIALLPWAVDEGYDYEYSMFKAAKSVDSTFVLFLDQGLKLPAFSPGGAVPSTRYHVGVLLHAMDAPLRPQHQQTSEAALVELAMLLRDRQDVSVRLLVYQNISQGTATLLEAYKLPTPAVLASEDELLGAMSASPGTFYDLLMYCGTEPSSPSSSTPPASHAEGAGRGRGLRFSSHHRRLSSSASSATSRPLLQDALPQTTNQYGLDGQHEERQQGSARAVVARMQARLAAVHNQRLSLFEVHRRVAVPASGGGIIGREEEAGGEGAAAGGV